VIVKHRISWIRLLFQVKGSSLEETWPRITTTTLVAILVTVVELNYGLGQYTLTTTPFTLVGVALGIFLGFRNNASYDRFWEARKLWGSLVNTSRSLARQAYSLLAANDSEELAEFRRVFVKRVIAFVHAFRHHLRNTDPLDDIARFLPSSDLDQVRSAAHRPIIILQQLGLDLAQARDKKWLHELNMPAMDAQLVELSNILGACERIKNTPIPFTYTVLIHRLVAFYCLFLPFGLVDTVGPLTPLVVFLISHAFFGLDAIGDEIEEPFGTLPNNLPLLTISRNIEINLLELIGDRPLPEPIAPRNGVLV
jgi:putative membrane protein